MGHPTCFTYLEDDSMITNKSIITSLNNTFIIIIQSTASITNQITLNTLYSSRKYDYKGVNT
jgi:hypothetical protein